MSAEVEAIIAAAQHGDRHQVSALLDKDSGLANAMNMFGSTAVHAAHYSGHPDVVRLLLERGRPLDGFMAAELGMIDELRRWLDEDPSFPAAFNASGSTALHGACYWGSIEATRLLVRQGADVNRATTDSFLQIRPLGCAVASPDVPNPSQSESVVLQLVDILLEAGADVNGRRRDGMTALHAAAYRGHTDVMRRLLAQGADPTIRANDDAGPHSRQTPLDTARSQGQSGAVALLSAR
jgi:uncharacterized protein